jgi:uncharacterized protein with HEPN domain
MLDTLPLLFESVLDHISKVEDWFQKIKRADDFVSNKEGEILLNAISMRLQALSENVKKIQKKNPLLLKKYPLIDWKQIIRFRDVISHHYELLDYQVVYGICKKDIPLLKSTVEKILSDLNKS